MFFIIPNYNFMSSSHLHLFHIFYDYLTEIKYIMQWILLYYSKKEGKGYVISKKRRKKPEC
ncbi:hypothetical protein DWY69_02935 [Eisenbergiella massiliensis]|uniref:Uncharacterized protein n=1 Tax=Eisenbergiella massiliensis TaxID=1720294 RepID=A0A3E3J409_9FIRM|nr:hypothetical protein DWY69_02935 [Eisenbergiella massiliensis]